MAYKHVVADDDDVDGDTQPETLPKYYVSLV